jgi:hypothetical protein
MAERASIEVPEATVRAMKACGKAMTHPSAEPSHAFQYNLGANEQGNVLEVKLHDATLRDTSLEACFERALAAMKVPQEALQLRVAKPFSGGESTYSSRTSAGFVQALAAPIALAPIIIPALGVTIIVAISLDIVRKLTAEQERCKQVKQGCLDDCSDDTLDDGFHEPMFSRCVRSCMEQANCG